MELHETDPMIRGSKLTDEQQKTMGEFINQVDNRISAWMDGNVKYAGDIRKDVRLCKLYNEVNSILNTAPVEDDCTDVENKLYSDMANLLESLVDVGADKVIIPPDMVKEPMNQLPETIISDNTNENMDIEDDSNESLEFTHEQEARLDDIYNAAFEFCKVMTNDSNWKWDMYFMGEIAEHAAALFVESGMKVYFPAIVTEDDGTECIRDYYMPNEKKATK